MESFKNQYENVKLERAQIIEQLNDLKQDEKVKKYLELSELNRGLIQKQHTLYEQVKREEYSSCNHIWVTTLHEYDNVEGRSYDYCGCIKCGLDVRVFDLMERYHNRGVLTLDEKIMYDFLRRHSYISSTDYTVGTNTNLSCDLGLAKAIYSKIKEEYPDIDDETAIKYFKDVLHNIRNTKENDEIKIDKEKGLSLSPNLNK